MKARIGPRASGFLSGLAALTIHAGAWGALELAPAERELAGEQPPALVWLEPPSVPAVQADPGSAAADGARPQIAPAQPRPRTARARRAAASRCAPATVAAPLDGLALATDPTPGASAAGEAPGATSEGVPPVAASPAGNGLHAASGAGYGAPAPHAQLLSSHPCAGYFPGGAAADIGEVQVDVEVDVSGHAALSSVLVERPAGQGFARAAQACARKLLFAPAHDGSGAAVPVHAKLRLVFKRA